jgi:hypothetical protein
MNIKSLIYHHNVAQSLSLDLFVKFKIIILENINNLIAIQLRNNTHRIHTGFWWEIQKEGDARKRPLERNLDVDGRKIIKSTLKNRIRWYGADSFGSG